MAIITFFVLLFVRKSRTILVQSLLLPKLSSCAGLVALGKFSPERCFQQWWTHPLTLLFLSCRKNPSCVCQEFDTGRAWVRKIYGCSIIGTWEMLGNKVPLASIVTVVTPCQGFKVQHGLISSRFADTLLLIVPHGHMCKFLVASVITVSTPCWGFRTQYGLISSHCVDTLLIIVLHGHMCKLLGVGEGLIFTRKYIWYQNICWYSFGHCWYLPQDLFYFKVRKVYNYIWWFESDFWIMLKIFYHISYLKQK